MSLTKAMLIIRKTSLMTFALIMFTLSHEGLAQIKKYNHWDSARDDAIKRKTVILIILTGEDWCKPCIKMKKEVLDHSTFISFAQEHLTLFEVNLPRTIQINSKVYADYVFYKEKYQTNSLPSLILTNTEGKEITRVTQRTSSLSYVMGKLNSQISQEWRKHAKNLKR